MEDEGQSCEDRATLARATGVRGSLASTTEIEGASSSAVGSAVGALNNKDDKSAALTSTPSASANDLARAFLEVARANGTLALKQDRSPKTRNRKGLRFWWGEPNPAVCALQRHLGHKTRRRAAVVATGELDAKIAGPRRAETGEAGFEPPAAAFLTGQVSVNQSGLSDTARPRLLTSACPVLGRSRHGGDYG